MGAMKGTWDNQFAGVEAPNPPAEVREILIAVLLVLPEILALFLFTAEIPRGLWLRKPRWPVLWRVLAMIILTFTMGISLVPI